MRCLRCRDRVGRVARHMCAVPEWDVQPQRRELLPHLRCREGGWPEWNCLHFVPQWLFQRCRGRRVQRVLCGYRIKFGSNAMCDVHDRVLQSGGGGCMFGVQHRDGSVAKSHGLYRLRSWAVLTGGRWHMRRMSRRDGA